MKKQKEKRKPEEIKDAWHYPGELIPYHMEPPYYQEFTKMVMTV